MNPKTSDINNFMAKLPDDKQSIFNQLRQTIIDNIPSGFDEVISGKMLAYQVPLTTYPDGYHCTDNTPLPFVSIACQKNFMALYHMGIYMNPELLSWFQKQYPKHSQYKLDMGKSCIRFKKINTIPFELIGELMAKMSAEDYIATYENAFKKQ